MITPEEIYQKTERFYRTKILKGVAEFPWVVRGQKKFADHEPLSERIEALEALRRQSKLQRDDGYTIDWIARRLDGGNRLPKRIVFETQEDLLSWLGKEEEYANFVSRCSQLRQSFPEIEGWITSNPAKIVKAEPCWDGLIEVLQFFRSNPRPGLYARELPLSVDTKFVETHQSELAPLLDLILPQDVVDREEHEFNRRFGLPWVEPAIRMRFLDPALQAACEEKHEEFSLPLLRLAECNWPVTRVFVVENLTSLQMLPSIPGTLGLMGHGKRIPNFRYLKWLENCEIRYWGDIDVQGFEILSSFRKLFPHVQSIWMDRATIERVPEHLQRIGKPSSWRKELVLTAEERQAYDWAKDGWRRIEQEHLPRAWMGELG
tara:strand:+ start:6530 stop:7657 length:1128 start_codon:yes stop_codon:yes gene_type:complete